MADFNAVEFTECPSVEALKSSQPRKDDLKYIATHFKINFPSTITKAELLKQLIRYFGGDTSDSDEEHNTKVESKKVSPTTDPNVLYQIEKMKYEQMLFNAQEKEKDRQYELQVRERQKREGEKERREGERERERRERKRESKKI